MQGRRSLIDSLPEILDFDHGSSSGNAIIDQQICWNNMQNPAENQLPEFMLSPSRVNNAYISPVDQERHNLSGWSLGEPSSSGAQNDASREVQKCEHGRSSSASTSAIAGSRLEGRRYEPTNILSLDSINMDPQFMQSSNAVPHNLNLNAGFVARGSDNGPVMESSNMYKSGRTQNEWNSSASGSATFLHPSGSGGYIAEENDSRPGTSLDGRRQSCKRKAIEGHIGQSSASENSSFFQGSESNAWGGAPSRYDAGRSLSISAPSEQVNPRLGLGLRGLASDSIPDPTAAGRPETSQRNFRLRINPSNQESAPSGLFSTGSAVRRSSVPSSHRSSRLLPIDHSLDFRLPGVDSATSHSQPVVVPVPALPQNLPSFRWNEGSSSRTASASSSMNFPDREEARSRNITGNIWEHPMFIPATDLRSSVRNPAGRGVTGGTPSIPGNNIASASRTGSGSGAHPASAPTWVSQTTPSSRNSRRLAELVRRSLFPASADSGGQSSTHSLLPSGPPGSSEEAMHSSGISSQGHHRSYPRSASWVERHGDNVLGVPYPLRTLAANGEGRGRLLVSEIRNVLDLMRRGESLRFEDVMILDQSVFFGVADVHDRHRDMRLDVDNMSYEELLALEERIGNVSTGLSEETVLNRLKQRKYSVAVGTEVEAEPCCVCQEEYKNGEDVGTLNCGHDFHTGCIKQWLMLKNWCPICKTSGLAS
ncbi:probable E3 ubiquitin-protein ligase RHG1A isoform X2 [Mercurialis annua]|uniref:probable E3 ubiquitin-protein ligase RHG1A isoform X2 n=1 Tax=Mercurialis annua TaxID=3986 RepID=UPI002160EC93|nr:probable E3 ubiquitin-protein ligase RHG1A isoform X2 [Mercurialis annua]